VTNLAIGGDHVYVSQDTGPSLKAVNAQTGTDVWTVASNASIATGVATSNDTVYFAGLFSSVTGVARNGLAAVDASTGALKPWNPSPANLVLPNFSLSSLAVSNGVVYLAGSFTSVAGLTRRGLVAIDAASGAINPWDPAANVLGARTVLPSGGVVYVSGSFTTIGGQPRNNVAAVDPITGVASAWNPNADGMVTKLAVNGDTVYLTGTFVTVGGQPRNHLAVVSATTGAVLPWNPIAPFALGAPLVVAASSSAVFVGGSGGLAIFEAPR
jgi:outer membrane protein assembly factor BamB